MKLILLIYMTQYFATMFLWNPTISLTQTYKHILQPSFMEIKKLTQQVNLFCHEAFIKLSKQILLLTRVHKHIFGKSTNNLLTKTRKLIKYHFAVMAAIRFVFNVLNTMFSLYENNQCLLNKTMRFR